MYQTRNQCTPSSSVPCLLRIVTLGKQKFLHTMGSQEVTSWKTSDNRRTIAGCKMVQTRSLQHSLLFLHQWDVWQVWFCMATSNSVYRRCYTLLYRQNFGRVQGVQSCHGLSLTHEWNKRMKRNTEVFAHTLLYFLMYTICEYDVYKLECWKWVGKRCTCRITN